MDKVCICLPWYKYAHPATVLSLFGNIQRLGLGRSEMKMRYGDGLIGNARNYLADEFLKSKCDWSFWVDDDMILPCGDAGWFNRTCESKVPDTKAGEFAILKLLKAGKTINSGLCFQRKKDGLPCFKEGITNESLKESLKNGASFGVLPTEWVGFGAIVVHRVVFEDMRRIYPDLAPENTPGNTHFRYFSGSIAGKRMARQALEQLNTGKVANAKAILQKITSTLENPNNGEDATFCLRAKAVGHQPYIDTDCVVGHAGTKIYGQDAFFG